MLLDTNILIYLSKPGGESLQEAISSTLPVASIVSKIEAYGYHRITKWEIAELNTVFGWVKSCPFRTRSPSEPSRYANCAA